MVGQGRLEQAAQLEQASAVEGDSLQEVPPTSALAESPGHLPVMTWVVAALKSRSQKARLGPERKAEHLGVVARQASVEPHRLQQASRPGQGDHREPTGLRASRAAASAGLGRRWWATLLAAVGLLAPCPGAARPVAVRRVAARLGADLREGRQKENRRAPSSQGLPSEAEVLLIFLQLAGQLADPMVDHRRHLQAAMSAVQVHHRLATRLATSQAGAALPWASRSAVEEVAEPLPLLLLRTRRTQCQRRLERKWT